MTKRWTHLPQEPVARLDRIHRGAPNGEKRHYARLRQETQHARLKAVVDALKPQPLDDRHER